MTTQVSGSLKLVTDVAASWARAQVRAKRIRPHDGGALLDFTADAQVDNGTIWFPCVPGPAVLTVMWVGAPAAHIPLVVPDTGSVSLEACMRAAELADEATVSELEVLAGRAAGAVERAESAAASAKRDADKAARSVDLVAESVSLASMSSVMAAESEKNAKTSETNAAGSATAAANSAATANSRKVSAAGSADAAAASARAAKTSETNAADSAATAKQEADRSKSEADRAAQAATDSSVKAVSDKVNELLAGAPEAYDTLLEIAQELARGQNAEAALTAAIAAKADKVHKHVVDDVEDLRPVVNAVKAATDVNTGGSLMKRTLGGAVSVSTPTASTHAATKAYVDGEITKAKASIPQTVPIQVVTALPASPDPNTLYLVKGA